MSGAGFLARSWAAEPVVCFSILLGSVGLAMPLFIPKEWSQKRDTRLRTERLEESNAKVRDALADNVSEK